MTGLLAPDFVYPIFGADGRAKGDIRELCGTAFSIGPGTFMTAGHVLANVFRHEIAAVGYPASDKHTWHGSSIGEKEVLGCDIGICRAEVPQPAVLPWGNGEPLILSEHVQAVGYPYGLDLELRTIIVRAFEGHIVSERKFAGLPERPWVYELSFQCPRGISGAPLLSTEGEGRVAGVVVSNAITEMEVYREREEVKEPGKEVVVVRTESLHLRIAVTPKEILALHSALLGCSVGEWLRRNRLLRR